MGNEWKSSTTCEIKCIFINFNLFEIKSVLLTNTTEAIQNTQSTLHLWQFCKLQPDISHFRCFFKISENFHNIFSISTLNCLVSVLNNSPDDCTMKHFQVAWGMAMQTKNFHGIPQSLQEHAKIVPKTVPWQLPFTSFPINIWPLILWFNTI